MNQPKHLLAAAIAALGLGVGALTAAASADQSATPSMHVMKHGRHGLAAGGAFMRAVHQLNLSEDQKQRIRSMIETQRETRRASIGAERANRAALQNPGDPGYAAAVNAAKLAAANEVQRLSDLNVQIYGILTPDQQAQLPKLLADLKNKPLDRNGRHRQPEDKGEV